MRVRHLARPLAVLAASIGYAAAAAASVPPPPDPVPEPTGFVVFAAGLAVVGLAIRRKWRS